MATRHAICIIAHKNVEQINLLIHLLDHPQIDLFLHLDKKSQISYEDIKRPIHSQITCVERHDVRWGDISIVEAELELFRAVVNSKVNYDYVHLISAQDMPVKSVNYILDYFNKEDNRGKEFIGVWHSNSQINRLKYYWLCTKYMRHGLIYKVIRHGALTLQRAAGINRLKCLPIDYVYGPEWASLTMKAVICLVQNYPKYAHNFKYTVCADELYKQMILSTESGGGQYYFSEKGNLRYAKFNGSSPELIPKEKVPQLINDPNILFARKFDMDVDKDAINEVVRMLNSTGSTCTNR